MLYRFGSFVFGPANGLSRHGVSVPLEPQSLELLHVLLQRHGHVVSREALSEHIWGGRIVSEASLSTQVRAVRRALGDDRAQQAFVKTYPKRGFKFAAPVEIVEDEPPPAPAPARSRPRRGASLLAAIVLVGLIALAAVGSVMNFAPTTADAPRAHELSIAVLPFDNLSGDSSQDYLADAFTEDLVTDLSRIRDAFVISRSTTFIYRGREVPAAADADELGVRYILEGSMRIDGETVSINAQLIDGESNSHVWSDRYERSLADLFDLRDNVTGRIGWMGPDVERMFDGLRAVGLGGV